MIPGLESVISRFEPITLKEMDAVKLLDRMDTKFMFTVEQLPFILEEMLEHYRLLDINNIRMNDYETLYFDTEELKLYAYHQSGKLNRYKVRYRNYKDSKLCFFEIKFKNNKGRTIKKRIKTNGIEQSIKDESEKLLVNNSPYQAHMLQPTIWVNYTRMTFVNKVTEERITIDTDLTYKKDSSSKSYPRLIIAEVKQGKTSLGSPFIRLMKEKRIKPGSISKYCFGIVNMFPDVKKNLFKPNIILLNKILSKQDSSTVSLT